MAFYGMQTRRWGLGGDLNDLKQFLAMDISKHEKERQLLETLPFQIKSEEFELILEADLPEVVSVILHRYYPYQAEPVSEHLILKAVAECELQVVKILLSHNKKINTNFPKKYTKQTGVVLETALKRADKDVLEACLETNLYEEHALEHLILQTVAESELPTVKLLLSHHIKIVMSCQFPQMYSDQIKVVLDTALKRADKDVLEACLDTYHHDERAHEHVILKAVAQFELPVVKMLIANGNNRVKFRRLLNSTHNQLKQRILETAIARADSDVLKTCFDACNPNPFKPHQNLITLDSRIIHIVFGSETDDRLNCLQDFSPEQYFSDKWALMVYETKNQNSINRYLKSAYESEKHVFPIFMMQACERANDPRQFGVRKRTDDQSPFKEMFQQFFVLHKDQISEAYLIEKRVLEFVAHEADSYFIQVVFDLFGKIIDPNIKVDGNSTMLDCILSNPTESSLKHLTLYLEMFGEKIELQKHNLCQALSTETITHKSKTIISRRNIPLETIIMHKLKAFQCYEKMESFNVFINTINTKGDTILWHVLEWKRLENIQEFFKLFAKNVDPSFKNEQSETAFINLCSKTSDKKLFDEILGILKRHFQQRININETDETGKSALLYVIEKYVDQTKQTQKQEASERQKIPKQIPMAETGGPENIIQSLFRHFGSQSIEQTFRNINPNLRDREGKFPLQMLVEASDKTGLKTFIDCCKEHGNSLDPNLIYSETQETTAVTAAKQRNGVLPVIHRKFQERYDPTIPDAKGYTVLMLAVFNYSPDFIKELLDHPNIGLLNRNEYEQDIMDIISDKTNVDERTKKLIEVAYNKQKQAAEKTPDTLDYHIKQAQRVLKSYDIPPKDKAAFEHQLDCFLQDVDNTSHGRHSANIGMSAEDRKRLQGNRVMLLDELHPKDGPLLDYLYQDNTLTLDQLDEIKSCQTRRSSVEKLLSILPYCGENAYDNFIEALKKSNKGYVADALENYDADKQHSPDEAGALVPVAGGGGVHPGNGAVAGGFSVPLQLSSNQQITLAVTVFNNNSQ